MALVPAARFRKRVYGFGDAAADAYLATPQGQAALQAAQAAAAKLPAGFTMGDPTADQWGASYYNGQKSIGTSATGPDGQPHYWVGDVGNYGPIQTATIDAAIQDAANAAYAVYSYVQELRTATPAMFAILSDPEWIALQGTNISWSSLSAELQDKIKQVPLLYAQFTDQAAYDAMQAANPYTQPQPTGPARYLIAGIEFYDNGTVVSVNGTPVSGQTLTQVEMDSLLKTGALPAGDPGPVVPASAPAPAAPATTSTTGTVFPSDMVTLPADGAISPAASGAGSAFEQANTGNAMPSVQRPAPPTGAASDTGGSAQTLASGHGSLLLYGAIAAVGLVALSRRKH